MCVRVFIISLLIKQNAIQRRFFIKKKTYLNSIIYMCVTWYQSNKKITNEQKSIKQVLKKKNRGNKQSII